MSISLTRAIQLLLFLFLLFTGLHYARSFLIPVTFGALFAMLLEPISERLERRMSRAAAIAICITMVLLIVAGVFTLISWQVADLASDATKIEQELTKNISKLREQITSNLGISEQKQKEIIQSQQSSESGKTAAMFTAALNSVGGILANSLLVLVYIFLFLYFRDRMKNFVLKVADARGKNEARQTMEQSRKVAQKYLSGLAMMIFCLWILYGIGFSIVGVTNALFFAVLCGLLEIVPFIGNLTGTLLTCLMVMAQGGTPGMLIGVLCIYAFVQTFQSYVLEPLVVGSNVNINPLFTIVIIVFGEFIWGIPGMILAIPLLGIVKIICDHVPGLQPVAYLVGEDEKESSSKWVEKIKGLFSKR